MPCYSPLNGFKSRTLNSSGKRNIVFNISQGFRDMPVTVPCGQCIGCRLEKSRQWAIRCVHEASLYEKNCFITLTYAPEHLPKHGTLDKTHFQKFMKRLRKKYGKGVRYFHCGEYGEKNERPHYHACLFNFDFPDKKLFRNTRGHKLYTSDSLQKLWSTSKGEPLGFTTIGALTFETAAYTARYILKKVTGKRALYHYNLFDSLGEIIEERLPEYTTMSRRPGIGKNWFEQYREDVFPGDFVVLKGKKLKPPRYYDKLYDVFSPTAAIKVKNNRKALAQNHAGNNTHDRLLVREEVQTLKLKQLKRSYESNET